MTGQIQITADADARHRLVRSRWDNPNDGTPIRETLALKNRLLIFNRQMHL